MTGKEIALIEAARMACVTAINACQTTLQVIETVLGTADHVEPDAPSWDAFDTPDAPTTENTNGKSNKRR